MEVAQIREHIEELVAEEHKLLSERAESGLEDERHQRLDEIQTELDRTWDLLRRREAGMPGDEALRDEDVPNPPNELDGPDPEPLHLDHGLHADGPSPDPGPHPNGP